MNNNINIYKYIYILIYIYITNFQIILYIKSKEYLNNYFFF